MKIISWNVNGIRAAKEKGFLDFISENNPDILCVQETKAQIDQLDESLKDINSYYSYFNSAVKKGYSGVAIYSKIEPLKIEYKIGVKEFDDEGRILIAHYEKFILFNIYFPNGQMSDERLDYKMRFFKKLFEVWQEYKKINPNIIICGDYNIAHKEIDLKNAKANEKRSGFLPIEREFLDFLIENGYIDTYRYFYPEKIEYSWWSYRFNARKNNAGWRIDYHFVTKELLKHISDASILTNVEGSDHCPIVLELK